MSEEQNQPRADPETEEERREREREEKSGGVELEGPIGFSARFPRSVAGESKWIIRAIALAIPILAFFYGLSFVLSVLAGVSLWIFSRNISGP